MERAGPVAWAIWMAGESRLGVLPVEQVIHHQYGFSGLDGVEGGVSGYSPMHFPRLLFFMLPMLWQLD